MKKSASRAMAKDGYYLSKWFCPRCMRAIEHRAIIGKSSCKCGWRGKPGKRRRQMRKGVAVWKIVRYRY